ncbi:hypothetical protein [Altererythrobacter lauratis]|uniref:Uncharacterized protein n=1 Tax=Alteraurantiacibacter lauratis TaxID=2054627 RepID=A0ABV7EBZ6_9SPHN
MRAQRGRGADGRIRTAALIGTLRALARQLAALLLGATLISAPLQAREADGEAAGRYYLRGGFEIAMQLELRDDGSYGFELAVGAKDERSSGTWTQAGNRIIFATDPLPVAPVFAQMERDAAADAPYLLVTWPDGEVLQGVTVRLTCAGGEVAWGYTHDTGWPYPENEDGLGGDGLCAEPQSLRLIEGIHDIHSPDYDVAGVAGGLRFVLHPNDLGLRDMTGWQAILDGDRLWLEYDGSDRVELVRYRPN